MISFIFTSSSILTQTNRSIVVMIESDASVCRTSSALSESG